MALRTIERAMRAGQWETSRRVVEGRRFPAIHCMASCATMNVISGNVIRIVDILEVVLMAAEAFSRCIIEAGGVAGGASYRPVGSQKREARLVVVDGGWSPTGGRMANRAVVIVIAG
jgi:hypothetical protein